MSKQYLLVISSLLTCSTSTTAYTTQNKQWIFIDHFKQIKKRKNSHLNKKLNQNTSSLKCNTHINKRISTSWIKHIAFLCAQKTFLISLLKKSTILTEKRGLACQLSLINDKLINAYIARSIFHQSEVQCIMPIAQEIKYNINRELMLINQLEVMHNITVLFLSQDLILYFFLYELNQTKDILKQLLKIYQEIL